VLPGNRAAARRLESNSIRKDTPSREAKVGAVLSDPGAVVRVFAIAPNAGDMRCRIDGTFMAPVPTTSMKTD
jgi:hypothetical protein